MPAESYDTAPDTTKSPLVTDRDVIGDLLNDDELMDSAGLQQGTLWDRARIHESR